MTDQKVTLAACPYCGERAEMRSEKMRLYENGSEVVVGRSDIITDYFVACRYNHIRQVGGFGTSEAAAREWNQPRKFDPDSVRYRALRTNVGREYVMATPGKAHDLIIKLRADGCEKYRGDGAVDFPATLDAILDDEVRIQADWKTR